MDKIFSKCGMRCDLCLIYRPNVEKEDRRTEICNAWKKIWEGFEPDPIISRLLKDFLYYLVGKFSFVGMQEI